MARVYGKIKKERKRVDRGRDWATIPHSPYVTQQYNTAISCWYAMTL